MTQTPLPPPGWYPEGGQERWWNGAGWSDTYRPLQPPAYAAPPVPYGSPQPVVYQPASGQSHVLRNVLLVLALVFVLLVGGCVALVAVVGHKVDQTVNDQSSGGPNVPKDITPGRAFSVRDFDYAAGWSVAADGAGDATIDLLRLTNHRDKADFVLIHIDLRQGNTVLATIHCSLPTGTRIARGDTATLSCSSTDPLPPTYDRVTINDDL